MVFLEMVLPKWFALQCIKQLIPIKSRLSLFNLPSFSLSLLTPSWYILYTSLVDWQYSECSHSAKKIRPFRMVLPDSEAARDPSSVHPQSMQDVIRLCATYRPDHWSKGIIDLELHVLDGCSVYSRGQRRRPWQRTKNL